MITGGAAELLSWLLQFRDINNLPFLAGHGELEIFTLTRFWDARGFRRGARPLVIHLRVRQTAIYSTRSEVNPRRDLTSFPFRIPGAYPGF